MLRRPATSISLTADDVAIFENQYAQGQIYAHHHNPTHQLHHHHQQQQQNQGPGHGFETPSQGGDGQEMAGEERRVHKTREERIFGTAATGNGDAVGSGAGAGAGAATATATTPGQQMR